METDIPDYKRNGLTYCILTSLLLLAYSGAGFISQWPVPLMAALLFRQNSRNCNRVAWAVMIPWTPLTIFFNMWARTILHTDAQAGLVYLFYPILIAFVSAACAVLFLIVYNIVTGLFFKQRKINRERI